VSSTPSRIDRDRLQQLVSEKQAQLVDVLSRSAFEALHLPDAINIPLRDLDENAASQLDRSRPVILYCYDHQ
jgi:rhodanese-related sulfurtransferase